MNFEKWLSQIGKSIELQAVIPMPYLVPFLTGPIAQG